MRKTLLLPLLLLCLPVFAQAPPAAPCTSLNVNTPYNDNVNNVPYLCVQNNSSYFWKANVGLGAPTVGCSAVNYGAGYTDIQTGTGYKCGQTGWVAGSTGGGNTGITIDSQQNWLGNGLTSLPTGISGTVLAGYQAGVNLGNWTPFVTTASGTSGSTTITVASASGIQPFNNVAGTGIAANTTVASIVGTTITLSIALTSTISSSSVTFTPGNTQGLVAIGEYACQNCESNNGSVVIGIQAMQAYNGNGQDGEDTNSIAIGPFADHEDIFPCAYGAGLTFESEFIGNKVYEHGCGAQDSQFIGNHMEAFTGATYATYIGGNTANWSVTGAWIVPTDSVGIGGNQFLYGGTGFTPVPGTYTVSNTNIVGWGSGSLLFNTHDNNIFGTNSFARTGTAASTAIQNNVMGNGIASGCSTCSYNVLIGGTGAGGGSGLNGTTGGSITTSGFDVFIGPAAGGQDNAGTSTAVGYGAGATATGEIDTFGYLSCFAATFGTNGCFGYRSGVNLTDGLHNFIFGNSAGGGIVHGSGNVAFGFGSGPSGDSSNTQAVGYNAVIGGGVSGAVQIGTGTNSTANTMQYQTLPIASLTTFSVSGCGTAGSLTGSGLAGTFTAGATSCTPVITTGVTAPHGFVCDAYDWTTPADTLHQVSATTTTATFATATVVSSDVIAFRCAAY